MADVYRQKRTENAEVLDGSWWVENQDELAGEFNGRLDRDNFATAVVTETMLANQAAVAVSAALRTTSVLGPDMTIRTWQRVDSGGAYLGRIAQTADVDCLLLIEWSGQWSWSVGAGWSATGAGTATIVDTVTWRITVNGQEVARTGPSEDMAQNDCGALYATVPLVAGAYEILVEVQVVRLEWAGLDRAGACTNTLTYTSGELLVKERRR